MEDVNTEVWEQRKEKDEIFRNELFSLFNELRKQTKSHIEFYRGSKAQNGDRFLVAFTRLYQHLQLSIESGVAKILTIAHKFDFDPNLPSNGYRSFVKIIHKCCVHLLQLSRHIAVNRGSLLFRSGHYSRELAAYVTTLGQLRACIYYLFKLVSYCKGGELFPDDANLNVVQLQEAQTLMKEVEALSQECFYGRCLGFQYCQSMQKPLMTICIFMASFSDGYLSEKSSMLMKVANSMLGGSRYVMDPELRGQKIVEVTRNCDIKFCQAFWAMNENDVMHTLPLFACPPVQLDKVIVIPPEQFELPLVDGSGTTSINPPCSHSGPGPVNCRLISYELRQGQDTWRYGSNNKKTDSSKMHPRSSGLLIHMHGGGFVAQSSASHEVYLRHWAKELHVPIFCIDYSLAPKHPFPRAFEECFFAYSWAVKNAKALGSTGERIAVCGDSAGANLAMAVGLHASAVGIRMPDGIQTTYGCQLVSYTPSPSRIMALMDPLLPLGIISRCLAAYAGMTEQTGVNEQMGAAMTRQTLFEMEEKSEMEKQEEERIHQEALACQEQAQRLQKRAQELLEETSRLRIRSLNVQYDSMSGSFSLAPGSEQNSPTKSLSESLGEARTGVIDNAKASLSDGANSDLHQADEVRESSPTSQKTVNIPASSEKVDSDSSNTVQICDSQLPGKQEIDQSASESNSDKTVTSSNAVQDCVLDNESKTENLINDKTHTQSCAIASNVASSAVSNTSTSTPNSSESSLQVSGHKIQGSNDSGFLDLSSRAAHSNDTLISPGASVNPCLPSPCTENTDKHCLSTPSITKTVESLVAKDALETNVDTLYETNHKTSRDRPAVESGVRQKPQLRLDLFTNHRTNLVLHKSPSSPILCEHPEPVRVADSQLTPLGLESPSGEFFTPFSSPHEIHTPSYAKVRHIAQSPVEQLTQLPVAKNPYMSPYFATDDMLQNFPPVYFVCCDLDPMLDDSIQMAKRLRDLGNEVHLDILSDLPHGFLNFVLISSDAKQGSELCVRRIRQILETDDEGIFHMDGEQETSEEEFEILGHDL